MSQTWNTSRAAGFAWYWVVTGWDTGDGMVWVESSTESLLGD